MAAQRPAGSHAHGLSLPILLALCAGPNHHYTNLNPNYAIAEDTTYTMPAYPMYDPDSGSWADHSERGGSIGPIFNGAMLYSPYGGASYGQTTDFESTASKSVLRAAP